MKPLSERIIIQVAHVVRDLEKAISAYSRIFEVRPWDVYTFAPPTLRESMYLGKSSDHTYRLAITWVGGTQLELMQPNSTPGRWFVALRSTASGLTTGRPARRTSADI